MDNQIKRQTPDVWKQVGWMVASRCGGAGVSDSKQEFGAKLGKKTKCILFGLNGCTMDLKRAREVEESSLSKDYVGAKKRIRIADF